MATIGVCAAIAGLAAWATGLSFWILAAILLCAALINGIVASIEDRNSEAEVERDSRK